jgi:hypothetical protein
MRKCLHIYKYYLHPVFGFMNVRIQTWFPLSARISRQLRLLRDHGLIRKVPKSYRYQLTDKGTTLVAALQAVRNATLERLDALAA